MLNISTSTPSNSPPYPVILLFGPTGVGKTELILRECSRDYEVISADSMQVYRGLDIGTAKPDQDMLDQITHHLIDIREPHEQFHVGDFVHLADALIASINRRGRIPVVSGGTAYYFKHLLYGLPETPPADQRVRSRLQQHCERHGPEKLYQQLGEVDPQGASSISPNDAYRIIRALEVYHSTGRPLSSYRMPRTIRPLLDPVVIGLTRPREVLYQRIEMRVQHMIAQGLYEEIRGLIKGGARPEWPGMKGIGYREFFSYRETGEYSLAAAASLIALHSRNYAKQQMTFFKSLPGVHWTAPEQLRISQ